MTLSKTLILTFGICLLGGCLDESYQTTLFDEQVTYCVDKRDKEKVDFAKRGKTGKFVFDTAQYPSKKHFDEILKPYGWVFRPAPKPDPGWTPSGIKPWKRQCRLNLPDNTVEYSTARIAWVDDNHNINNDKEFPQGYKGWSYRAWFVEDKLVHIEVGQ